MIRHLLPYTLITIFMLPLVLIVSMPACAESQPDDRLDTLWQEGFLHWDEGDYVEALEKFQKILANDPDDRLFEKIALQTGYLYQVHELTEDGENVRFSPGGRFAAYDRQDNGNWYTHVVDVSGGQVSEVDRFQGREFAFAPDGQSGAYLQIQETEELEELEQQMQQAFQQGHQQQARSLQRELQWLMAQNTRLMHRNYQNGSERPYDHGQILIDELAFDREDGTLYASGLDPEQADRSNIYYFADAGSPAELLHDEGGGYRTSPVPVHGSRHVLYQTGDGPPFPVPDELQTDDADSAQRAGQIVLYNQTDRQKTTFQGGSPVLSDDGSTVGYMSSSGDENRIHVRRVANPEESRTLVRTDESISSPALSPDGGRLAYMMQPGISWNVYLVDTDGGSPERFTNDIQHELFPDFLDDGTLMAMMGESRHRRAHLYDLDSGDFHRVFSNDKVRTVSMEYEWQADTAGEKMLLRADRDGNTISDEEGVYMVDFTRQVSMQQLRKRVERQLASERERRLQARQMYAPIRDEVREATRQVNIRRLYDYQKALYDFDSKYYTEPGNRKASEYIYEQLESFGYEPELQWFSPDGEHETANVVARLEGSEHPEVVYVLSSHFDSVRGSPGADDNTSGTAVLLETARVLADKDLPATIIFASLTAEEAGLVGAREFVRRANEESLDVAGVINNDMMGWTRHHRLDNTIRFSNYGIRDIQHASSMLFSDLITYDSRYYRFTDAHVFFDAYGDVIGGIGSYPILGNPNYHQPTDRLEVINHDLVKAVTQSNTGVFMKLAYTPSMIEGVEAEDTGNGYRVSWDEPLESDISHYQVRYTTPDGERVTRETGRRSLETGRVKDGGTIKVRAVNERGLEGWDWAEINP